MTIEVSPVDMSIVSAYIHDESGIVLTPGKEYLVQSRLGPILQREQIFNYSDLIKRAQVDSSKRLRTMIVDSMTTNETSFFRDEWPFDLMAHKLIPDILMRQLEMKQEGKPRIDIWSAASSTGQEVYSIAMILKEMLFSLSRYWIRILGTDISEWALSVGSRGVYSDLEISRGLSERRRDRFFCRTDGGWKIDDELRSLATFGTLNLIERFRHVGTFDIILCRNVAIYFSLPRRVALFDGLADQLRPNGILLIGSTENLHGISERFVREEFHGAVFYRKVC